MRDDLAALLRQDLDFPQTGAPALFTESVTSAVFNLNRFKTDSVQAVTYLKLFILHAPKLKTLQLFVPDGSHNDPTLMAPFIPLFNNCHNITHLDTRYELLPYLNHFDCTLNSLEIYVNHPAVMEMADLVGKQNTLCLRKLSYLEVCIMLEDDDLMDKINASKVHLDQVCGEVEIKLKWLD